MIKNLSLLALGVMSSAMVFAQQPELNWVAAQDGKGLEIGDEVIGLKDGSALVMTNFQSSAANGYLTTDFWSIDMTTGTTKSEKTFTGHPDEESANGGENMALYKIDKNGQIVWGVNSYLGDFAGKGTMAATPDNGAILCLKMRVASRATISPDILFQLTDTKGKVTTVTWENPDYTTYGWVSQPVLVKISGEGEVEWTKRIKVDHFSKEEKGTSQNWSDCFDMRSVTCDESGNFYVAGRSNTNIDFGENVKLTNIRNANGWNGDTQNVRGDLFVAKFNSKGEAQWVSTSAGDAVECESLQAITYANNTLYVSGYMKGDNTKTVQLGNCKVIPGSYKSLFAASLSADNGEFKWARMYNSTTMPSVAKPYAKPMCITVDGDDVYLGGSFQGNIIQDNDETNVLLSFKIKNLSTYILRCSATDGTCLGAIDPVKALISEIQAIHVKGDVVVATGYNLMKSSYTFIMDRELSEASLKTFSVKDNKMGTSQDSKLIGENLITLTRGKNTVNIPGVDWTYSTIDTANGAWSILIFSHALTDFLPTSIENAEMGKATFNVYSQEGSIVVEASEACQLKVYNVLGSMVYNAAIEAGNTTIALPKGIYIVNGKKTIVF